MRKVVWLAVSFFIFLAMGCGEPKVAATVNGKKIYTREVDEILERLKKDHTLFFEGEKGRSFSARARREILEGFIENILIEEEAEKIGVKLSQEEIEKEIGRYKKVFGEKNFKDQMKEMGWSEKKLREEVRKSLLVRKVEEKIKSKVKVSQEEVEDFYEKNKNRFIEEPQVKIAIIVLERKEDALEVKKRIKRGEDFLALANIFSIDRESKGKFLWKKETELPSSLFKAAFNLEKGEVSEVIEEGGKFYLLKLEERKAKTYLPLKEVRKSIEEELLYKKKLEAWKEWLRKLRKKAKIEIYL